MRIKGVLAVVLFALLCVPATQSYADFLPALWENGQMTILGTLGGEITMATAINDVGQVVEYSYKSGGVRYAVLWQGGVATQLTPDGVDSVAQDINELGQIVGFAETTSGYHAVLWENGVMTDLGTLGGNASFASGINNLGQIVGYGYTSEGSMHAFLWENGVMTDLGLLPGSNNADALAINNLGQVVGSNNEYAFLWKNCVITDLGTLSGHSVAYDINDLGWAVGYSFTGSQVSGEQHAVNEFGQIVGRIRTESGEEIAFLWEDGVVTSLGIGTYATDINNNGD